MQWKLHQLLGCRKFDFTNTTFQKVPIPHFTGTKKSLLTDEIFETGAYGATSKSHNPTVLCQGGPSSTQCSNPSWRHPFGTNNYPPFQPTIKNKVFSPSLDSLFFAKIRL